MGKGQIINGKTANARSIATNPQYAKSPPYKNASLASEGKIAAETRLVRVYTEGVTRPEGRWIMLKSDIEGLTPAQIQTKFALENLPNRIVDVNATGMSARVGTVAENFGHAGEVTQIELLEYGATFTNPSPLPTNP
jgi:hypothetical protein